MVGEGVGWREGLEKEARSRWQRQGESRVTTTQPRGGSQATFVCRRPSRYDVRLGAVHGRTLTTRHAGWMGQVPAVIIQKGCVVLYFLQIQHLRGTLPEAD